MSSTPVVELQKVHKTFRDGTKERQVFDDLALSVAAGELVAIVGASGSGKTSLLNVVSGLDIDYRGEARVLGESLGALSDVRRTALRLRSVGFVFQSFHLLEHLSVGENVLLPLWLDGRWSSAEQERLMRESLGRVQLQDRIQDSIGPLSGGERQRVAIARALVNQPQLLLADEPTGNLDRQTGSAIFQLFDDARRGSKPEIPPTCAVLVVTHDPSLAGRADRVLVLRQGRLFSADGADHALSATGGKSAESAR